MAVSCLCGVGGVSSCDLCGVQGAVCGPVLLHVSRVVAGVCEVGVMPHISADAGNHLVVVHGDPLVGDEVEGDGVVFGGAEVAEHDRPGLRGIFDDSSVDAYLAR